MLTKKNTLSILFLIFAIGFISAQPDVVIKALKQKYPSATNISWVKKNHYDEDTMFYKWKASFNLKDRKASSEFTQDGHWLYSQGEITFSEIGVEEVKSAIKKSYPDCEIISVIIHNSLYIGTWYDVKAKCGNYESESSYDSNGWPWPPRI